VASGGVVVVVAAGTGAGAVDRWRGHVGGAGAREDRKNIRAGVLSGALGGRSLVVVVVVVAVEEITMATAAVVALVRVLPRRH
jgi:predicted hotdog family 3-hydroxylacyl-ACP dehydratase